MERIYTRPLVPSYLFEFGQALLEEIPNRNSLFLIYHPKISLIVDPTKETSEFRQLAFTGSVDLLLVDGMPEGIPFAAFDLYVGPEPRESSDKVRFFQQRHMSYRCLPASSAKGNLKEMVEALSIITPDVDRLREAINRGQWAAMEKLERIASSRKLTLLHEVGLDQVIAVDSVKPDGTGKGLPFLIDQRFLKSTSFDAILCTQPPNAKPICAIEFDGSDHDKTHKKENDRRKNAACIEAKLPLVRIPASDIWRPAPSGPVVSIETGPASRSRQLRSKLAWDVLGALIDTISQAHLSSVWYLHQLHYFIRQEADRIEGVAPWSAVTLKELADELWNLAQGRFAELEDRSKTLESMLEARYEYDDVLADIHYYREYEEVSRSTESDSLFEARRILEMLENDFDVLALNTDGITRLFDWKFSRRETVKGSVYGVEVSAGPLLRSLQLDIESKEIVVGPIGILVIGDHLGEVEPLMQKLPRYILQRMALRLFQSEKRSIQSAARENQSTVAALVEGAIWAKMLPESIESHISQALKSASVEDEFDWDSFTAADRQAFRDIDNWAKPRSFPKRRIPREKRSRMLDERFSLIRASLESGGFAPDVEAGLLETAEAQYARLKEVISST